MDQWAVCCTKSAVQQTQCVFFSPQWRHLVRQRTQRKWEMEKVSPWAAPQGFLPSTFSNACVFVDNKESMGEGGVGGGGVQTWTTTFYVCV